MAAPGVQNGHLDASRPSRQAAAVEVGTRVHLRDVEVVAKLAEGGFGG